MQKLLTFFSAKILAYYAIFNDKSFNYMLTNDIVSFEQLGPNIIIIWHSLSTFTLKNLFFSMAWFIIWVAASEKD